MEGNEVEEKIVGDLDWDGLHRPRIYYAVATTFCGLFLSVLDGSICNVALPSIARELGVSSSDSIWIVNAFQLVIMMTILPFASMGERWGYKQVYLRGVIVFTIGSLFCALSHNLSLLVISRVFQGFGAAMIMSVNTSLIKLIYPKRRLGEGVGLNATVVAIASVAGPTLAAGILSVASWPWLFAINVPVGVVTFFMGRRYLPDNAVRVLGHRFNWKEALLNAATFGLFIGCVEAYSHDVPVTWVLGGIVSFVIIGTFYVRMQLRERYPMLPFDLLKIPIFSMSVVTSILSFTAQMLSLVAMHGVVNDLVAVGNCVCRTACGIDDREGSPRYFGWGWVNYYECRLFLSFIYSYRNRALRACVAVDVVWNGFRIVPVSEQSYVA